MGSDYGYYPVEEAKDRFEVTAVDFSASAVSFAKKFTKTEKVNVDVIQHEFFKFEVDNSSGFDAVYDYVTYSAINPAQREEYAILIKALLKCDGFFIALWFLFEEMEGEPPFRINLEETKSIFLIVSKIKIFDHRKGFNQTAKGNRSFVKLRKGMVIRADKLRIKN